MGNGFQVDVVATPRLDLCGAAAKDLLYRDANGKYPMASRSQMAKEQEKLNKFLQYVNESFIIKGFTRSSGSTEESPLKGYTARNTVEEMWFADRDITVCDFRIPHGDGAQILVMCTIAGDGASASSKPAKLSVRILENGSEVAAFAQDANGNFTMSVPLLLTNRAEGVTQVQVLARVTGGEVYVDKNGAFGQALAME